MRKGILSALVAACLWPMTGSQADAGWRDLYEVYGVDDGDMLKLRAGPGTGFVVIVGLPNGSVIRVLNCQREGHTSWCKIALDRVPTLKGYVSEAYIKKL